MIQLEEWKDIEEYEGMYQVSNYGNVKSLARQRRNSKGVYMQKEKLLSLTNTSTGYKKVELVKNGKKKSYKVHRLVAMAFIDNPENKPQVNHIDGNKTNNHVDNLEWVTSSENSIHAYKTGLNPNKKELNETVVVAMYVNGTSKENIAKEFGVSNLVIKRILKENAVTLRTQSEAKNQYHLDNINLEEELKTKTQAQLAQELGCSQSLISKKLNNKY